jgi:hypothetical protein
MSANSIELVRRYVEEESRLEVERQLAREAEARARRRAGALATSGPRQLACCRLSHDEKGRS